MTTIPLRKFVEHCARRAEAIFKKQGRVLPMYHAIDRDGQDVVFPSPPVGGKDEQVAAARLMLEACGATRVAFIDEAWALDQGISDLDMKELNRTGLRNHPNRIEVILIAAEDQNEGMIMASSEIIRHGDRAVIAKLKYMDEQHPGAGAYEGRMIGLLPRPKMKQRH